MDKEKKSFLLYTDNIDQFNIMSDEQAGKLIKAIFYYSEFNSVPEFVESDGMVKMAFSFIRGQIDRDNEKWENTRNSRIEAGRTGGKKAQENRKIQANQANASFAKASSSKCEHTQANQAVNVNVNDNVNVNVNNINPLYPPKGEEAVENPKSESFSELFEDFWKAYPKKVSKKNAFNAWNKLKPNDDLVRQILSALEKQKMSSQWQKDNGQFIPYPATWLNGRRWEDEQQDISTAAKEEHSYDLEDFKALVNNFED